MTDFDKFDDELMSRARELSADVQPERDLWPSIEAAIAVPARPAASGWSWKPMLAQAAAVILLVGGSSTLTYLAVRGDSAGVSQISATNVQSLDAVSASFGGQYALGPDFQDARRDLEGTLEQELDRLSPETRAEVEESLKTIRTAIASINEALVEEPDNALLQELLMRSYRDELAVMRRVNGIANAVMYREDI